MKKNNHTNLFIIIISCNMSEQLFIESKFDMFVPTNISNFILPQYILELVTPIVYRYRDYEFKIIDSILQCDFFFVVPISNDLAFFTMIVNVNGDTVNGDTIYGDTVNGDTVNGDTVNGDTIYGDTVNGDTVNGDTVNGDTVTIEIIMDDSLNTWIKCRMLYNIHKQLIMYITTYDKTPSYIWWRTNWIHILWTSSRS